MAKTKKQTASQAIGEACGHVEWLMNAYPDALNQGLLAKARDLLFDAYKANEHEETEVENATEFNSYGGVIPRGQA